MNDYNLKDPKVIATITAEVEKALNEDDIMLHTVPLYRSSIYVSEDAERLPASQRGKKVVILGDHMGNFRIGYLEENGNGVEFYTMLNTEYSTLGGAKGALTKMVNGKFRNWGIIESDLSNTNENGKITYEKDSLKLSKEELTELIWG